MRVKDESGANVYSRPMSPGDSDSAAVVFMKGQPTAGLDGALALCHPSDLPLLVGDLLRARQTPRVIDLTWLGDDADVERVVTRASWLLSGQGHRVEHRTRAVDEASLPEQLDRVKQRSLSADVGALLSTLVSVFEPLPRAMILAAARVETDALEDLIAHGLVIARREWVTVGSPHLRDELARRLRTEDRTRRHLELFELLSRDSRTMSLAARLAPGLALSGGPGPSPRELAKLTVDAARTAISQHRYLAAASHLRDAIASRQLTAQESQETHILRGRALSCAGLPGDASDAFRVSIHGPDRALSRSATQRAAKELLVAGRVTDGMALLEASMAAHGEKVERSRPGQMAGIGWRRLAHSLFGSAGASAPSEATAELCDLLYTGAMGLAHIDGLRSLAFQARHVIQAHRADDPLRLVRALCAERVFVASWGRRLRGQASSLERRIAELRATSEDLFEATRHYDAFSRGQAHFLRGELDDALVALDEAAWLLSFSPDDLSAELEEVHIFRVWTRVWRGDLEALNHERECLTAEARRAGVKSLSLALAVEAGALLMLARDEGEQALELTRAAFEREAASRTLTVAAFNAWAALLQAQLYAGRKEEAARTVRDFWPRLRSEGYLVVQIVRIEAWLLRGRVALAIGNLGEADNARRHLRAENTALAHGVAAFIEAAATRRRGEDDEALHRALREVEHARLNLLGRAIRWALGDPSAGIGIAAPTRFFGMLWGAQP